MIYTHVLKVAAGGAVSVERHFLPTSYFRHSGPYRFECRKFGATARVHYRRPRRSRRPWNAEALGFRYDGSVDELVERVVNES